MKGWLLHTIFAVILITSVAANGRAGDVLSEAVDIEPAIIRAAQSRGMTLLKKPANTEPDQTLIFDAPACARPVLISLLFVTFDQEPLVREVGEPGDLVRFIYLDHSWSALPNRLTVFLERKKHQALELFGLTPYVPLRYMLRLSWAPGCEIVRSVDWRIVWKRDYLAQPGPS
jgi:hypothetical protein